MVVMMVGIQLLVVACCVPATAALAAAAAEGSSPNPPPPPHSSQTDYIDCNVPCDGGDVNYELTASVKTMQLKFGAEGKYGDGNGGRNYIYKGRTFSEGSGNKDGDGTTTTDTTHMGPTMFVSPGQSLHIKLRNELYVGDTFDLKPGHVNATSYWQMVQKPGEKIKYTYYKLPVESADQMQVDHHNIPGQWDITNLHLHGLDVEGTSNVNVTFVFVFVLIVCYVMLCYVMMCLCSFFCICLNTNSPRSCGFCVGFFGGGACFFLLLSYLTLNTRTNSTTSHSPYVRSGQYT